MHQPPRRPFGKEETITVTDAHLALLPRANWRWEQGEWGAPAMDTKRPFGNSDVVQDIAEITNPDHDFDADMDDQYTDDDQADFIALAFDLVIVMEILTTTLGLKLGTYTKAEGYSSPWIHESENA